MKHEDFQEMLDWMMAHGIVDFTTYNLLLIKALPYLE